MMRSLKTNQLYYEPLSKSAEPNFNMGSTRVQPELGEKSVSWAQIGVDGLQFRLCSIRAGFFFFFTG